MARKSRTSIFVGTAVSTAIYQVVLIAAGFIVPRLIIGHYGSDVNGLITSLTQFINYFSLVEAGISGSAVVMLYAPLAKENWGEVSKIVTASKWFYIKAGLVFLSLVAGLAIAYPLLSSVGFFSPLEVSILVFLLGAKGVVDFFTLSKYRVLLTADRRTWVIQIASALYQLVNVAMIASMIAMGQPVIVVYAASLVAVFARTIILVIYTKVNYKNVDFNAEHKDVVLDQRWDVLFLQILGIVQQGAPVIIATVILGDYALVSVFSVYLMISNGVQQIPNFIGSGLQASFGELMAKGEDEKLRRSYAEYETLVYIVVCVACSCAFALIGPFVNLYVGSVNDQNYIYPMVGFLSVLNVALYHAKSPHGLLVIAAGLYRRTRWQSLTQALILVLGALLLGWFFGMEGILAGMCLSNLYRTIDLAVFIPKYVTKTSVLSSVKRLLVNAAALIAATLALYALPIGATTWSEWILWAAVSVMFSTIIVLIINFGANGREMRSVVKRLGLMRG